MKRHVAALVSGLAVGFGGVRLLSAPTAPVPTGASEAPTAESPVELRLLAPADCPGEADRHARLRALAAELEDARRVVAIGAAQAELEVGAPIDWPADVPDAFTEAGIERGVTDLLDEVGAGRLLGLDCGEYPCVGLVRFTGPEADAHSDALEALVDASVYANRHRTEAWKDDEDGQTEWLVVQLAFPAAPLDPADSKRVSFRMNELLETFEADLDAEP